MKINTSALGHPTVGLLKDAKHFRIFGGGKPQKLNIHRRSSTLFLCRNRECDQLSRGPKFFSVFFFFFRSFFSINDSHLFSVVLFLGLNYHATIKLFQMIRFNIISFNLHLSWYQMILESFRSENMSEEYKFKLKRFGISILA